MIDQIKKYNLNFKLIEEAPFGVDNKIIGWHSTLFDNNMIPIASGCGKSKEIARRIATAEAFERGIFHQLYNDHVELFLLNEFPSTSGFAAGFEDSPTKLRAIAEAVERWAWSQWIDKQYPMRPVNPAENEWGEIGKFFSKSFEEIKFFHRNFTIEVEGTVIPMQFAVSVGFKNGGAFPGSRVCSITENPWEHGITEAWRHTVIADKMTDEDAEKKVYNARVRFFSKNQGAALAAIEAAKKIGEWPEPKLRLLEKIPNTPEGVFVWRALCHDFIGWHLGPKERFVY